MNALSGKSGVDVAIWLGLEGGKAAEQGFESFGHTGKASLAEIKEAAATLNPGLVAVSRSVGLVKDKVGELAAETGGAAKVLSSFGGAGLAVAAVAGAIGLAADKAVEATKGALEYADGIQKASEQAKVSTDTIQTLRYALHASGGDWGAADGAIVSFREHLGQAEAGMPRALKWFQALGFTQDQLKGFGTFDEALDAVIKKIAGLKDPNEQLATAQKLGLEALVPLLSKGVDGYEQLKQEAMDLGLVMDTEMVKRAAEANIQFETLSKVIDVQFKQTLIDLGPVLLDLMKLVSQFASGVDHLAESFKGLGNRSTQYIEGEQARLLAQIVKLRVTSPARGTTQTQNLAMFEQAYAANEAELKRRNHLPKEETNKNGAALGDLNADKKAKAAASLAAHQNEEEAKAEAAIKAAGEQELAAQLDVNATIEQRAQAELDKLDLERDANKKQLANDVKGDAMHQKLTKAEADRVDFAQDLADDAKRSQVAAKEQADLAERRLKDEQELGALTAQLLSIQSGLARTAAERRGIELQALALSQKLATDQLEAELAKRGDLTEGQKQQRRDQLAGVQGAQLSQTLRSTQGPIEAYRDTFLKSNQEIQESLQSLAVDGLRGLNDGLVEAIMQSKSLGDVFSNVADTIVAGLARIAIQQTIIKPLADFFQGQSGGSGFLGQLGNVFGAYLGAPSSPGYMDPTNLDDPMRLVSGLSGRAGGGAVYGGDVRRWNEAGPEVLAPSSDGYVFDAASTRRRMTDATPPSYGGGGGDGPVEVNLNNSSGVQLAARATQRRTPTGGRALDVELFDAMRSIANERVADLTSGRRDDQALKTQFGVNRRLSGS